jgi:hypothetical protein
MPARSNGAFDSPGGRIFATLTENQIFLEAASGFEPEYGALQAPA